MPHQCAQAYRVDEWTGLYDTLIESGHEIAFGLWAFDGADFSTFISTLNSSFLYQSNSFTSTASFNFNEVDDGSGYHASTPLGTTNYTSGSGTSQQGTTSFSTYISSGWTVRSWQIGGGGSAWSWTFIGSLDDSGDDNAVYSALGGGFATDHRTFHTSFTFSSFTASGHKPPVGAWPNQTTTDTSSSTSSTGPAFTDTVSITVNAYSSTIARYHSELTTRVATFGTRIYDLTRTVATTTLATTQDSTGYSTFSDIVTFPIQSVNDDFFYDPFNFYRNMIVFVPITTLERGEWVWKCEDPEPGGPYAFTDIFEEAAGQFILMPKNTFFPVKVLTAFDDEVDSEQTFNCTTGSPDITDPVHPYNVIVISANSDDTNNGVSTRTVTRYFAGSLPMDTYTSSFQYVQTAQTSSDAGGVWPTITTFAAMASKTIPAGISEYSTIPEILAYVASSGETTTSFVREYLTVLTGGSQTTEDGDFIITDMFTYRVPSVTSVAAVRTGFDAVLEGQTVIGIFPGTGPALIPGGTGSFPVIWPETNVGGLYGYRPMMTTGFQAQPFINTTNPVFEKVGIDLSVSDFGIEFFNAAMLGLNGWNEGFSVGVPFQFYYVDGSSTTGASANADYTFEFVTNSTNSGPVIGNLIVTHKVFEIPGSTQYETFTASLYGDGSFEYCHIDSNRPVLTALDANSVFHFDYIFGGRPRAYGAAIFQGIGGGDTVNIYGVFNTYDELGGSGVETFLNSFEMATDELTGIGPTSYYTVKTDAANEFDFSMYTQDLHPPNY